MSDRADERPAAAADGVQNALAKLKRKYALGLPDKVSGIAAALATFASAPWNEELCTTAYRQVHSLAGSSGTYGFDAIVPVARDAESILKRSLETRSPLTAADRSRLDGLAATLRDMAAAAAAREGAQ